MYVLYSPRLNQLFLADKEFLNSSLYIFATKKLINLEYIGIL